MFRSSWVNFFDRIYRWWIRFCSRFQSLLLFLFRLVWGLQFMRFGWMKLQNPEATAQFFSNLHLPAPMFHAYLVGCFEWFCGLMLVLGLATRLISLPLLIIMFVAYSTAHVRIFYDWEFLKNPSLFAAEKPYPFLVTSLIVLIFGPGKISLDAWLEKWFNTKRI